jgi:hypothetical protein
MNFEEAWASIYWMLEDEAFDYRDRYTKQRFMTMKAGVVDFERMTFDRSGAT